MRAIIDRYAAPAAAVGVCACAIWALCAFHLTPYPTQTWAEEPVVSMASPERPPPAATITHMNMEVLTETVQLSLSAVQGAGAGSVDLKEAVGKASHGLYLMDPRYNATFSPDSRGDLGLGAGTFSVGKLFNVVSGMFGP